MSRRFDRSRVVPPRRPAVRPPAVGRFARHRVRGWTQRRWPLRRPVAWRSPVRPPAEALLRWRPAWPAVPRSLPARLLTAAAAVALFAAATWTAARSPLLDVDHVEVLGAFQVSAPEAVEASGIHHGQPLLDVDRRRSEDRLRALPWVRSARVERAFPNRVRLRLGERQVAASAARPTGGFTLLDPTGRVLADRPDRPQGLPEITGAGAVPAPGGWVRPARPALEVVGALPEPLRRRVVSASAAGGDVVLRVKGTEVRFGPPEQLEAKAAALSALLDHLDGRPVAYIDVRVPSAPVVGPGGPGPQAGVPAAPRPRD